MARIFRRKSNGVYYIDYFVDGRRQKKSTGTKNRKEAERCLQSRLGDIVQGKFKLEDRKPAPYFEEFSHVYLDWAKQNKKSWERDVYSLKELIPVFGGLRLAAIHPFKVEQYKIDRKKKVKPATVNREVALLKRILNIAVEWGKLKDNPIRNVKALKEPRGIDRFLSEEECSRLVKACQEPFRSIVITALNTGMRKSEILNLRWKYVNLKQRLIIVTDTKNGDNRFLPMNQTMLQMLSSMPRINEYVFVQQNGRPYSWINRAWRNAKARAGIENCRFHDLRHTYASHLAMKGVDLMTLRELMGHKSMNMIQRYAHLSADHKRQAVEQLDSLFTGENVPNVSHSKKVVNFDRR